MLVDKKRSERSVRLFPWYYGLSADLIFYIAINTIWLIEVKGFTDVQMNLLSSVTSLTALICVYPMLKFTKKVGNANSIRIGAFCLLFASILFTFCKSYFYFIIGEVIYELSFLFAMMSAIVLKNNLEFLGESEKYIEKISKGSLIYAVLTALATLLCGFIFNLHEYLPMILGITLCLISFILSLFITDKPGLNNAKEEDIKKDKSQLKGEFKIIFLIIFFYGFAYALINFAQKNGKLLIQNALLEGIAVDKTAIYLSYAMFISRVMRIFGNMIFPKMYRKLGNKTGIIVVSILFTACGLILFGTFVNDDFYVKAIIMALGFSFVPMLRDPLKIFTQNMIFEKIDKKFHEDAFAYMTLGRNIFNFILSICVSTILVKYELKYLFIIFVVLILPLFYIIHKLIKMKNNIQQ